MRVIAVDGPAGAGKSTVCSELARRLGFVHINSGLIYRSVAWALKSLGIVDENTITSQMIGQIPLTFDIAEGGLKVFFDGKMLATELQDSGVAEIASRAARIPAVREFANLVQRQFALYHSVVVEGRDATTVVFPDACLKVFLSATPHTRAFRRWKELESLGKGAVFEEIVDEIIMRDQRDMLRTTAPLKNTEESFLVDTTELTVHQVVDYIEILYRIHCFLAK